MGVIFDAILGKLRQADMTQTAADVRYLKLDASNDPVTGELTLTKNLEMDGSTSSTIGNITKGGTRFIHNYAPGSSDGRNIFVGLSAGNFTMSGTGFFSSNNMGFGGTALRALTTGHNNVSIGADSSLSLTTGGGNVAIGSEALYSATIGSGNVAIGSGAHRNTTSNDNASIGDGAGRNCTSGGSNVFIGKGAAQGSSTYGGSDQNTIVGYQAGFTMGANMDGNVFIGYQAGYNETGSNKLYIANSNTSTPLIQGDFSAGSLIFNGDVTIKDAENLIFSGTTGTKIGTATTQKIGVWNATPIVQPTTAVAAATFAANTSAIADDTATFDGYTIGQVVKALRNIGLLA